jgi:archaellum component FlaG (FlaF/FlaG flagellin family)
MGQGSFPSPATTPTAPQHSSVSTAAGIVGTWSDSCANSRDSVTFAADGGYTTSDGAGTWSLDGSTVTLSGDGQPMVTRWVMVSPTEARVTVVATGETETALRCS